MAALDATGLQFGTYPASIVISSNDSSAPQVLVPTTLVVEPRLRSFLPLLSRR